MPAQDLNTEWSLQPDPDYVCQTPWSSDSFKGYVSPFSAWQELGTAEQVTNEHAAVQTSKRLAEDRDAQ